MLNSWKPIATTESVTLAVLWRIVVESKGQHTNDSISSTTQPINLNFSRVCLQSLLHSQSIWTYHVSVFSHWGWKCETTNPLTSSFSARWCQADMGCSVTMPRFYLLRCCLRHSCLTHRDASLDLAINGSVLGPVHCTITIIIIIITLLIGACISIFPNHFKAPQGSKLWSLLPMGSTQCANHYPTIYIYCTEVRLSFCNLTIWMKIVKVQVNGPKRGGSKPEYPDKKPTTNSPKIGTTY